MSPVTQAPTIFDGSVTVVRVVSRGNGTDWATLSVADEHGELVTVVGTTLGRFADPGRRLHIFGFWKHHPRYGLQVQVSKVEAMISGVVDSDPKRFLERAPHVGTKRAQLLIDRFGEATVLARIDDDPGKAFRQLGMPSHHAVAAANWWRGQR